MLKLIKYAIITEHGIRIITRMYVFGEEDIDRIRANSRKNLATRCPQGVTLARSAPTGQDHLVASSPNKWLESFDKSLVTRAIKEKEVDARFKGSTNAFRILIGVRCQSQ